MSTPNALASSSKPSSAAKDPSKKSKKHKEHKEHKAHKSHKEDKDGKHHKKSGRDKESGQDKSKVKASSSRHAEKDGKGKEKKGPFELHTSRMRLSVPPKYSGDWMAGVRELLDGMVMRYVSQLSGVLLAHWEHEIIDDTVKLINECPFGVFEVEFRSIVWAPKIGQKLYGTHSLSSPSHLSLLFSKTFNVSIPLQHIPLDEYIFEHTSREDQPDLEDESDISDSEDEDGFGGLGGFGLGTVHEVGRWKSVKDGKLLGEGGKGVKFTVIGMQITNQVLSLTGSLLADPSNPPPPPSPARIPLPPSRSPTPEPMDLDAAPVSKKLKPKTKPQPKSNKPTPAPRYTGLPPTVLTGSGSAAVPAVAAPVAATRVEPTEEIDERFLSARELKKKRKDDEKKKRDARKSKKEEKQLEEVAAIGGERLVGVSEEDAVRDVEGLSQAQEGKKRKAEDESEGKKKKRKEKA